VDRWDLGRPARDARFRQLLFATAADGVGRRARLTWSLVVPPDVRDPDAGREPLSPLLSRMTVGAATRVRHKLDEHAEDDVAPEFLRRGDPAAGRVQYLARMASER
jgi:hypothetical protein